MIKRRRRFAAMMLAHGFGQFVTLGTNFLLPSIFLAALGAENYGYWVFGLAISQFLNYLDLGICTALSNRISLDQNKDDRSISVALLSLTDKMIFRFAICCLVGMLVAIVYRVGQYIEPLRISMSAASRADITILLCLAGALNVFAAIWMVQTRRRGVPAHGIIALNSLRVGDFAVICIVLWVTRDVFWAALAQFIFRLMTAIAIVILIYKSNRFSKPGPKAGKSDYLLRELRPAANSAMFASLATTISLQSPVVVLGALFSSASAAEYSVCRTLSRVPSQLSGIILDSLSIEQSESWRDDDRRRFIRLVAGALFVLLTISSFVGISLLLCLDLLERHWLHGKIDLDWRVLGLLSLINFLSMASGSLQSALLSINRASTGARLALTCQISMTIATTLAPRSSGAVSVAMIQVVCELLLTLSATFVFYEIMRSWRTD